MAKIECHQRQSLRKGIVILHRTRPAPPSTALPVSLCPGPSSWLLCPWSWAHDELSQQGFLPLLGGLHRPALTSVLTWDEVSHTLLCWFSVTLIIIASTGLCACLVTADTQLQMIWWISLILTEGNITRLTELWDEWSSWRFYQTPPHWVPISPLIMTQDFLSRTCSRGISAHESLLQYNLGSFSSPAVPSLVEAGMSPVSHLSYWFENFQSIWYFPC